MAFGVSPPTTPASCLVCRLPSLLNLPLRPPTPLGPIPTPLRAVRPSPEHLSLEVAPCQIRVSAGHPSRSQPSPAVHCATTPRQRHPPIASITELAVPPADLLSLLLLSSFFFRHSPLATPPTRTGHARPERGVEKVVLLDGASTAEEVESKIASLLK